jgi:hypothetical protein
MYAGIITHVFKFNNKYFWYNFASMQKMIFLVLAIVLFTSCEKEVDIKLNDGEKKIVVEGVIEIDEVPYVTLTRSIGFFDKIDLSSIEYIKNAQITVIDITASDTLVLKEYVIDTVVGANTFNFSIYGPDLLDPNALNFKGIAGHMYKISILDNNQYYEAFTQIPINPGLDSVWLEPVPGKEDSFSVIKAIYTDPDTFGNSVKLQTKTNRYIKNGGPELFFSSFSSVYNDNIINGTSIPLTIDLGFDKSKTYTQSEYQTIGYVRKGDTVTVKWSAIDKNVFTFWETLSFSEGSVGNPFASPVQVQGNIKNALGVWGGYGSKYYTLIDSIK